MTFKNPNRIAAEDAAHLATWMPPEVGTGSKVLASAEKESRDREQQDNEIIEEVDGEVDCTPMTAEELQAITDAAEREGFERGYTEGFSKGEVDGRRIAEEKAEQETREQLGAQVSALLQVAEALVEPIAGQEEALEKVVLDFIVGLTRQLVERELQLDSSQVLGAVQAAIRALPVGADNITIALNPDDLALLETYADEQQKGWVFRADTELLPGGCRIESRDSLVDFSVEKRLDELCNQFLDKQLVAESDATPGEDDRQSPSELPAATAADVNASPADNEEEQV